MGRFQPAITINEAINRIQKNEYFLPAFQREFEWDVERICKLFDSLMKGYPINSMLFWKVKGTTKSSFKFYKFLDHYIEDHHIHNDMMKTDNLNDFWAILDGQQRLTSLYISLCGSYAYHEYYKSRNLSESSYPTRQLYFNISRKKNIETEEEYYSFDFLPKSLTQEQDLFTDQEGDFWFRTGRILSLHSSKEYCLDDFIEEHQFSKLNKELLRAFNNLVFVDQVINYYEEEDQIADKAVNIFVRINSGGLSLSFSDILMSIAVANWQHENARTEIHTLVDTINEKGFSITKDYVLKSFLYLYHKDIKFQIHSFDNGFMGKIEKVWPDIRDSILSLFDTLRTFGLNYYSLTSNNATLPVLYYIYHKSIWKDFSKKIGYKGERELIKKWLLTVLIRRTFGAQSDSVLMQSRKAFTDEISRDKLVNTISQFPSAEILQSIKKITDITEDYIDELLLTQKDSQYSFPILSLLYPNLDYKNNDFHQDHTHPEAFFEKLDPDDEIEWTTYNSIINLQMLDANENMSKNEMPLEEWVFSQTENKSKSQFLANHIIPNIDLSQDNIKQYLEARKELLRSKLKSLLS